MEHVKTYKWLQFDEDSGTFEVVRGSTTDEDVGVYIVMVTLKDRKYGLESVWSFQIAINPSVDSLMD
jgi:hypothetical protein